MWRENYRPASRKPHDSPEPPVETGCRANHEAARTHGPVKASNLHSRFVRHGATDNTEKNARAQAACREQPRLAALAADLRGALTERLGHQRLNLPSGLSPEDGAPLSRRGDLKPVDDIDGHFNDCEVAPPLLSMPGLELLTHHLRSRIGLLLDGITRRLRQAVGALNSEAELLPVALGI